MRIRRPPFRVLIWLLAGFAVLAGMVYIEATRDVTSATVVAKRERIEPNLTGSSWNRRTDVFVRFEVDRGFNERWIRVGTDSYDALSRGSSLRVRYSPVNPDWVRPASQTIVGSLLQDIDYWQAFTVLVLVGGVVAVVRISRDWRLHRWWMAQRSPGRRLLVLAMVLLWTQTVVTGYFSPHWPELGGGQRDTMGEAQVRAVTTITQLGGGHRSQSDALPIGLPQGFDRVELSLIPEGWSDPVIAVDEVDEDSAGVLNPGATLPVRYSLDNPRHARLDNAERSQMVKNPLLIHGTVSVAVMLILLTPLALRWYRVGSPLPHVRR